MKRKTRIKVVPDTNVLIQGIIFRGGNCRKIINWSIEKELVLIGSQETYEEFKEKVSEKKFKKMLEKKNFSQESLLLEYKSLVTFIEPFEHLAGKEIAVGDRDDDIFFRVASISNTKIIISNDRHLLKASPFKDIRVVKSDDFTEHFENLS